MDDDDAAPSNFTYVIHEHLRQLAQSNSIPPFKTFTAKNILQWDMIFTKKAPYGWLSDWHRKIKTVSCGFSLLGKYPAYNFSVMGLDHAFAENYFNLHQFPISKNVEINRKLFNVEEEVNEDTIIIYKSMNCILILAQKQARSLWLTIHKMYRYGGFMKRSQIIGD